MQNHYRFPLKSSNSGKREIQEIDSHEHDNDANNPVKYLATRPLLLLHHFSRSTTSELMMMSGMERPTPYIRIVTRPRQSTLLHGQMPAMSPKI